MVKAILTDIEGTTSSITFVHDVLFPYAAAHLEAYVRAHETEIGAILDEVRSLENNPGLDTGQIIAVLQGWIAEDKKITPLKSLQGLIWADGYKAGAFKGHVYDDAAQALRDWHGQGLKLYVYSSGSVAAQKLIFGYSEFGDLTPLFSGYFDTTTGPKLEAASYTKIAETIGLPPQDILFLSDNLKEIKAAQEAGMDVMALNRDGNSANDIYPTVTDFKTILNKEKAA